MKNNLQEKELNEATASTQTTTEHLIEAEQEASNTTSLQRESSEEKIGRMFDEFKKMLDEHNRLQNEQIRRLLEQNKMIWDSFFLRMDAENASGISTPIKSHSNSNRNRK